MYEIKFQSVWVNGCFDLLHPGHLDLLYQAAEIGEWLIVGINSDESVKLLKGDSKPIMSLRHRRLLVQSIDCVDQVVIIHGERCDFELRAIQPQVVVKGKGYDIDSMCQKERAAVDSYGGQIRFLENVTYPISTGQIINRCRECDYQK